MKRNRRRGRDVRELIVKVVDVCEMRCSMCGQGSSRGLRRQLSRTSLEACFEGDSLDGKRVYLWGGEPLLHPEIHEIIGFFKRKGARVGLNTNGYEIDRHLERLMSGGLDRLILSVDGIDARTHDSIRGVSGSFSRLVKAMERFAAMSGTWTSCRMRINFVVLPSNYQQIPEMVEWCRAQGAYRVQFQLPMFLSSERLSAYSTWIWKQTGRAIRDYRSFLQQFDSFECGQLAELMKHVATSGPPFARFYPFECLTEPELELYFKSDLPVRSCRCDMFDGRVAIDATGSFVTCPDFPDIPYSDLDGGVARSQGVRRMRKQLEEPHGPLPVCVRCCHFAPRREL
jgi:MoaA/NifB/PqqE/SkfB family radical SAM enzyme